MSPYIFKTVLAVCLRMLSPTVFLENAVVSYIAYSDDVLLVSHTRSGLTKNLNVLTTALSMTRLSVNASKCKFLCFNISNPAPSLHVGTMLLECVSKLKWLGISFSDRLSTTWLSLIASALLCIHISYGKILPNKGRHSRRALCKLYHSFCSPTVLFHSGFQHLMRKKDRLQLRRSYFKYCKLLLYLPRWCRNH